MILPPCDAEGFVLAGGKSSRMGKDKSLVRLECRPLIQHAIQILRNAGLDARIAGRRADLSEFAPVVLDQPEQVSLGPLAGICSALSMAASRFAVFLPVDVPLIPPSLIRYLIHHAALTASATSVVSVAAFIHTFPVVVDRAALPALQRNLASGDRNCLKAFRSAALALRRPFSALPLELLVQPGLVRHSRGVTSSQWFLNINSPHDLTVAEDVLARSDAESVK
ncbi:MAG TPA: molybdenum cofactor guanylyltransferase [Terracidiphilus sp.]|nr:molybdenum cofactor guanylyltransferase [Terracidiphilus sp.]